MFGAWPMTSTVRLHWSSMARLAPGSATSSFFIIIQDSPELDFGGKRYPAGQGVAVFGQVLDGRM